MLAYLQKLLFDVPNPDIPRTVPGASNSGSDNTLGFILLAVAVLAIVAAAVAILAAVIVKNRKKTLQAIREMQAKRPDGPEKS
jgi:hypothetical protein